MNGPTRAALEMMLRNVIAGVKPDDVRLHLPEPQASQLVAIVADPRGQRELVAILADALERIDKLHASVAL